MTFEVKPKEQVQAELLEVLATVCASVRGHIERGENVTIHQTKGFDGQMQPTGGWSYRIDINGGARDV